MDVRDKALGAAVSILRNAQNLTQREVAERMVRRAHYSWNRATVSKVELGQRRVRMAEAIDLSRALGTTVPNLLAKANLRARDWKG